VTTAALPASARLAGILTASELTAAGVTSADIRRLVRQGFLRPLGRGVYACASAVSAVRGPAGEHALRIAAALAACGPDAVGSHHHAAVVHGLDLLGQPPAAVAVTRPPTGTSSRTGRPGVHIHSAALPAGHVTARLGVGVTSVARTVADLARASSFRAGVAVADSALRTGQTCQAELRAVLAECHRWPGSQRAQRVVAFADGRAESVLESVSRVVFREQQLPYPDLQVWVGRDDVVVGRVDFLWRSQRTIGEADGAAKYADPGRAMAQLRRDAELRAAGFEVVHFTWEEIMRVPAQVAATIRAAFTRASRAASPSP
jgi:very-short-patch-repair endonuclease/predicted transcriptional regulator of viral defense system